MKKIRSEYDIMKKLKHPYIVEAKELIIQPGWIYLVMEYLPYESLKNYMVTKKKFQGSAFFIYFLLK